MFHRFSSPHEGDFLGLAEDLSCRVFRRALDAVKALDAARSAAVAIDSQTVTPDRFSTRLWNPEVGHVLLGLTMREPAEWPWMSAQLAVTGFLNGLVDELSVEVASDRWLDVAGHSVKGERLSFEGRPGRLTVSGRGGCVLLELVRVERDGAEPAWTSGDGEDLVALGCAGSAALADGRYVDQWQPVEYELGDNSPAYKAQIEDAMTVLEAWLPLTFVWVAALLREVTALARPAHGTRSSSFLVWPGHVRMSAGATLVQTIGMLVHECCHQYFYLTQLCAPLTRKDAPEVFSVLKQTTRPLERVLLGFHAFGNVLLAQEQLLDGQPPVDRVELEEERAFLRRTVAGLDRSLQGAWEEYLQEAGAELYLPLRRRLVAAGLLGAPAGVG